MDDLDKLEKVVKDAKDLLTIFEDIKEKNEINNKTPLFKNIDKLTIAKYIVPYMDIKDIINFRTTCRGVNAAISSTVSIVSYYKAVNKKKQNEMDTLRSFNELTDTDDIQIELESVKKIRDFLTQKLFQSESLLKLYRNDLEYLKSELKSQNEITERLSETLSSTREELEDAKKINHTMKTKLDDTAKKYDESVLFYLILECTFY
jgi:hypothetical protein